MLKRTLELSGLQNISVFPFQKGGGYLISKERRDFLFYLNSEERRVVLQSLKFDKECKEAVSRLMKGKPCYYYFHGNHSWEWKARGLSSWKQDERLATIFRIAGVRKKFSVKIGKEPGFFSGNIGGNAFMGQWLISAGYFFIAMEEIDESFLKAIDKIMGVQPLARYRQCLPINGGEIAEFFVWDNINSKCNAAKLREKELSGDVFQLKFYPLIVD
ncbi:MAG: hypothetical protein U5L10_01545 [Candidatus Moranbacteria bacterium]|nr:hypothetical protein [Candidatus Moranbacteria bacterium]